MGLDITAYSGLRLIGTAKHADEWEEKYIWSETAFVHPGHVIDKDFGDWTRGLTSGGVYEYDDSLAFRAGSYYGYGEWRSWLCWSTLGVQPDTVWSNEEEWKEEPFFRIINFTDCDGIIGPEFSEILYKDFLDQEHITDLTSDEWRVSLYMKWKEAFKLASDNGLVHFH